MKIETRKEFNVIGQYMVLAFAGALAGYGGGWVGMVFAPLGVLVGWLLIRRLRRR